MPKAKHEGTLHSELFTCIEQYIKVRSVRQYCKNVFVKSKLSTFISASLLDCRRCLPNTCGYLFKDFVDAGVESDL